MTIIENERLRAQFSHHGAELTSLYDKKRKHEIIWQADEKFWPRHAPILFPNVGKYYGGAFRYNNVLYPENQHGFARDMDFFCSKASTDSISFRLIASVETVKRYPFLFILEVTYTLLENGIESTWKVFNSGDHTMYFTIGGHPAFNVPVLKDTEFTDYSLFFEGKTELEIKLLDIASGCINNDAIQRLELDEGRYRLHRDMFDNDALVFDEGQIEKVSLLYPDLSPYVTMECEGFPNFGIWSKPGAPFVCLEPWMGRCDNLGFEGEIKDKPGITALETGEEFSAAHRIIVG